MGYTTPANISTVAEYLQLVLDRGIFVDLLSDKEVCDMTMAQFSRDDYVVCLSSSEYCGSAGNMVRIYIQEADGRLSEVLS